MVERSPYFPKVEGSSTATAAAGAKREEMAKNCLKFSLWWIYYNVKEKIKSSIFFQKKNVSFSSFLEKKCSVSKTLWPHFKIHQQHKNVSKRSLNFSVSPSKKVGTVPTSAARFVIILVAGWDYGQKCH